MASLNSTFETVLTCQDPEQLDKLFNDFNREVDKVCTEQGVDVPIHGSTILLSTQKRLSEYKSNLDLFENTLVDAILNKQRLNLFEKSFILPRHAKNINKLIDKIMHDSNLSQETTYTILPPLFIHAKENDITPFTVDSNGIIIDQITSNKHTNLYLVQLMEYHCIIPLFHQDFLLGLKKPALKKVIHNLYFMQDVTFTESQLRKHVSNQRELVMNILKKNT
jgi:hypothetical protein